jgi:hypothetical protein
MFEMTVPVWELIARSLIVYVVLMVIVRVSGKRTLGQFTPFAAMCCREVRSLSPEASSSRRRWWGSPFC